MKGNDSTKVSMDEYFNGFLGDYYLYFREGFESQKKMSDFREKVDESVGKFKDLKGRLEKAVNGVDKSEKGKGKK